MTYNEYKEVIKSGERVDWHGVMVPEVLITPRVRSLANMIINYIGEMEDTLNEYPVGKTRANRQRSIERSWENVKDLPYTQNGLIYDFFKIKYNRIIEELGVDESKPKKKVIRKKPSNKKLVEEKPTSVKNTQVETKPKEEKVKEVQEKVEEPEEQPKPKVRGRRSSRNSKLIFGK